jgi:hypothetical protein
MKAPLQSLTRFERVESWVGACVRACVHVGVSVSVSVSVSVAVSVSVLVSVWVCLWNNNITYTRKDRRWTRQG